MSPRKIKDLLAKIEADGESAEATSFVSVIKTIEDDDPNAKELMADLPSLVALLKLVHKQGFWYGADFGKKTFIEIDESEDEYEE